MALEAVVFSQDSLITSYNCCSSSGNNVINNNNNSNISNDNNNNIFGGMNEFLFSNYYPFKLEDTSSLKVPYNVGLFEVNNNTSNIYDYYCNYISCTPDLILQNDVPQWNHHHHHHHDQHQQQQYVAPSYSSPEENHVYLSSEVPPPTTPAATPVENGGGSRRKRRRRSCKNTEEVEHQRMTHIAVERNRRKQMNQYLAVIRSLMPSSYVQRGDQASIVGGAINYVKELEQLLQSMEAQKTSTKHTHHDHDQHQQPPSPEGGSQDDKNVESLEPLPLPPSPPLPFADFFSFPQYSTRSKLNSPTQSESAGLGSSNTSMSCSSSSTSNSGVGDIEVTMVESHANVKILAKKQPKQLVKLIAGFQGLRLYVLHLNVTTLDSFVLYSLSLKVEEGCQLNSVDDIAAAANHILGKIQEEAEENLVQ